MDGKRTIEELPDALADWMYRDLLAHISARWDEVERRTRDFSLLGVRGDIAGRVAFPEGCGFTLHGYELILRTPMPVVISYGMNNFRIGPRVVAARYREEIAEWFSYLIGDILPGALTLWRERTAALDRDRIKSGRIMALESKYKETTRP